MEKPRIVVFDVNETLLSLHSLKDGFASVFGSAELMGEWFARMLHGSLVSNHLRSYRSFGEIGVEALLMVGAKHALDVSPDSAAEVVGGMRTLAPHPEVTAAITAIREAGYRTAALTNGSTDVMTSQLENAGLLALMDVVMSCDEVERFKPAPEVYLHAAMRFDVEIDEMMLVAAHDWDCAGAMSVGAQAAFVKRPGVSWSLPTKPPTVVTEDLAGVLAALT